MIAATLAGTLLGLAYYVCWPRAYLSSAQVLVSRKHPDVITGADTRSSVLDDYVSTHQDLLRSRLVIERAIRTHHLAGLPSFTGDADVARTIDRNLTVSRNHGAFGENNVLQLTFRASSPEDARRVLEAVLGSYMEFLKEKYRDQSDDIVRLVARARDELGEQMKRKRAAWDEYQTRHRLLSRREGDADVHRKRLTDLQTKLSQLELRRAELEAHIEAVEDARKRGADRTALLAMLDEFSRKADATAGGESRKPTLQERLLPLLEQEQKLLQSYGPNHPDVVAVRRQIEATRAFYAQPAPGWTDPVQPKQGRPASAAEDPIQGRVRYLRQQLAEVTTQQKHHQALYDQAFAEEHRRDQDERQVQLMKADIDQTKELYDVILRRMEVADLAKGTGGYDADVISAPADGRRVAPALVPAVPLAALLGLLVGVGLAYVAAGLDQRFRSAEEVPEHLGVPLLATLPTFGPHHLPDGGGPGDPHPMLCAYHQPRSTATEAFRQLRTALCFSALGQDCKVVQVTSPTSAEGKSTLAANLAVSVAQSGKRVLLVDADLRAPRQHELFGVPSAPGLAAVLAGETDPPQAFQPTAVPGLTLLPCGPLPAAPAELLTAAKFTELVAWLRERFDFVLLDTPPVLGTTDASVAASRVDGVLLVLRLDRDGRPTAERARAALETVGARILGVVVNDSRDPAADAWGSPRLAYRETTHPGDANGYQASGTSGRHEHA